MRDPCVSWAALRRVPTYLPKYLAAYLPRQVSAVVDVENDPVIWRAPPAERLAIAVDAEGRCAGCQSPTARADSCLMLERVAGAKLHRRGGKTCGIATYL